jgi:hypothetical protein
LWPADERATALLPFENALADQRIHRFAHGAGGQLVFSAKRSLGGNGLAGTPAIVGDLLHEVIAQALVERQTFVTGERIHRLYSPCYLVIYMNMVGSISPYDGAVKEGCPNGLTNGH